jgi:hypothetical protein
MKLWADLWDLGEATDCFTMVLGRAAADRKCVVTAKRRVIALVTDCIWHANQNMQSGSHDGNWDYLAGSTPNSDQTTGTGGCPIKSFTRRNRRFSLESGDCEMSYECISAICRVT